VWQLCELLYTCYLLTYLLTTPISKHCRDQRNPHSRRSSAFLYRLNERRRRRTSLCEMEVCVGMRMAGIPRNTCGKSTGMRTYVAGIPRFRQQNRILRIEADKPNKNWLPRQRPLRDRKTNFRSFIYSQSSTNPADRVKIGPVNVDIIGLTEIVKNKKQRQNLSPPCTASGLADK